MRISGCRLGEKIQDRLAEFFVGWATARSAANRKTAAYFFHRLRRLIAKRLEDRLPFEGLIEVDESYFGIRQRIVPDSIVHTDSFVAYDVLDVSEFHHHRIDHSHALRAGTPQSHQWHRKLLEPRRAHPQPL